MGGQKREETLGIADIGRETKSCSLAKRPGPSCLPLGIPVLSSTGIWAVQDTVRGAGWMCLPGARNGTEETHTDLHAQESLFLSWAAGTEGKGGKGQACN